MDSGSRSPGTALGDRSSTARAGPTLAMAWSGRLARGFAPTEDRLRPATRGHASRRVSVATGAAQGCTTPEDRGGAERMTWEPAERKPDEGLGNEVAHWELGLGGLAHVPRYPTLHEPY